MAKKNQFLEERQKRDRMMLDVGLQCGRQQILDMMSLVLNDPDIMGKDTFGKDRLMKVVRGIGEYIDLYEQAWQKNDESDYYQKKMDDALAKIYGEEMFDSFHKRYEYAPEFDYSKGKWKK